MDKLKHLTPAIVATILTIIGSGLSGTTADTMKLDFDHFDKVAHFGTYIIVTFLWCYGLEKIDTKRVIWKSLLIALILGLLMESLQYAYFIGRQFEFYDIIANISGSLTGVLIYKTLFK